MDDSHGTASIKKLTLLDLISLEDLQRLQDTLADMLQVAIAILDPKGQPLTYSRNAITVCEIIQSSVKGFKHCMMSNGTMGGKIGSGSNQVCNACDRLGIGRAVVPISPNEIQLASWWVSQYCGPPPPQDQWRAYAEDIGVSFQDLQRELLRLPTGKEKEFTKIIEWIGVLSDQFAKLVYDKHALSHNLSRISRIEEELERQRFQMERQVEERTAELIETNNRLQLEVMERDLAEELALRKTRLLDAINLIFQETLADKGDASLAHSLLDSARKLTHSPFGLIAERKNGRWQIIAMHNTEAVEESAATAAPDVQEINNLWRQLMTKGDPIALPGIDEEVDINPFPKCRPALVPFLAVPLCKDQRVSGVIVVARKEESYALVDQKDVEALTQAFTETLLRKRVEREKDKSEKRLKLALESANEGLWDYAPSTGHIYYSPRWFSMLGYVEGEFPDTLETWSTLTHPEDLPLLEETLRALSDGQKDKFDIEVRMLARSGRWPWLQVRGRTVAFDKDGKAKRIIGTLSDISKFKQIEVALQKANDELQRLAVLDDLTQIANRRRFEDRLAQEWRRGQRDHGNLSIIICDIDFFKHYNDTYGHVKGDETLHAVAQAISAALKRPMDLVARFGGEEFAIILPNTDVVGAHRVAMEVKAAILSLAIEHKTSEINPQITLSFGVASLIPSSELTAKVLIKAADRALYRAKLKGRDQIHCVSI
jgi:diguanylate cyclase (GGDEF)-like protein/PAS domain S-box-containing protein